MSTTCSDQFIIDPRWIEPDYSGDARPALHSSTATLIIGTSLITISTVWLLLRYARLLSREISALISLCEAARRSEEHTSELQSLTNLVCRLLLEKKNVNS